MAGASGIRTLEMPLSIAPGSVNIHVVPTTDGPILIDCGMSAAAFDKAGIDVSRIQRILLTHVHPDHSGIAAEARARSGAPVLMHAHEDEVLASLSKPEEWLTRQDSELAAAGVPAPMLARIRPASLMMRRLFPTLRADGLLEDGQVFSTRLGPMVTIITPGHSPGHACFHFPERRILIAGDQLLEPGGPHLDFRRGARTFAAYLASLRRLARLDVDLVLPSHGRPFRDLRARIDSLEERVLSAAAHARQLWRDGYRTAHEITLARWNRAMHPFEHRSAVYETMTLLESLA